jgi:hypothetical protein
MRARAHDVRSPILESATNGPGTNGNGDAGKASPHTARERSTAIRRLVAIRYRPLSPKDASHWTVGKAP